jgi:hypothetical protein
MASGSDSDGAPVGGGPNLVCHENRFRSLIPASEEGRLRRNYDIPESVTLHFQGLANFQSRAVTWQLPSEC